MTFNISGQFRGNNQDKNEKALLLKSDIEVSQETIDLLNSGLLVNLEQVVQNILRGDYSPLEKIFDEVAKNNNNKLMMHFANLLTFSLERTVKKEIENTVKELRLSNFTFEYAHQSVALDYEYDEDQEDYDEEEEVVYKKVNRFNERNVDAVTEIENIKQTVTALLEKINCKILADIILTNISNSSTDMKDRPLIGDKNAYIQAVINLQKIAIAKNSLDDFNYIKEKGKVISALVLNNTKLQNQIFTEEKLELPRKYFQLRDVSGKDLKFLEEGQETYAKSMIIHEGSKSKNKNDFLSNLPHTTMISHNSVSEVFYNIYLQNCYLSLNDHNVENKSNMINYDIINIKGYIKSKMNRSLYTNFTDLNIKNPTDLYLFANKQVKKIIQQSMDVNGRNIDLAFVKSCKKLIVNSSSLGLYDLVLEDEVFKNIFTGDELFKEIISVAVSNGLYKFDYFNDKPKRPDDVEQDTPLYFYNELIDLFEPRISLDNVNTIIQAGTQELLKVTEEGNLEGNISLFKDLSAKIREKYLLKTMNQQERESNTVKKTIVRRKI